MAATLIPATPEQWAARLESQYTAIWRERMSDVPVINGRLGVEATGFCDWNGHVLGVLVTPWFMNLMLLPGENDDWSVLKAGSKRTYEFEAGAFEFIAGEEPEIGTFMSCSMFSPMFEFESHEAAMETARGIIGALFDAANQEQPTPQSLGDDAPRKVDALSISEEILEGMQVMSEATQKNMHEPLSRREMLRGSFLRARAGHGGQEKDSR